LSRICVYCGRKDPAYWRDAKGDIECQYTEIERLELEPPNPFYVYRVKLTGTHAERLPVDVYLARVGVLKTRSLRPSVESHEYGRGPRQTTLTRLLG